MQDADKLGAADRVGQPRHDRGGDATDLRSRLTALEPGHPSGPGYLESAHRSAETGDRQRARAGVERGRASSDAADVAQKLDPRDSRRRQADAQYAARQFEVEATLADWRKTYRGTEFQHTTDDTHKIWSKERAVRHDEIIQHLYARAAHVPCEGKAILAGGLPGAGKTTVLAGLAGIDRSHYLVINPDGIKAQMARRHMVPVIPGLSPMEASELAHEESSHIAKQLALRAYADLRNVIWDITMSSTDSTQRRIRELRAAGYVAVEGIFIDIPVEVSLRRAEARHRKEHDAYRAGAGLGGRYIAPDLIRAQALPDGGSTNRATFEQVKQDLNRWRMFDNSVDGRNAVLTGTGKNRGREKAV